MFTQFLERHRPDSTQANPAFMKKTSAAVSSTQTVSSADSQGGASDPVSVLIGSGAAAGASAAQRGQTASGRNSTNKASVM